MLITGVSKSGFGGGLGVLAVPLMSIDIPPRSMGDTHDLLHSLDHVRMIGGDIS